MIPYETAQTIREVCAIAFLVLGTAYIIGRYVYARCMRHDTNWDLPLEGQDD